MVEIDIHYEGDLRTVCIHKESGAQILTDAPKDNQGLGREFSPTDLVAAAVGSCTLTLMGIIARKLNVDMCHSKAHVIKEMQTTPRRIAKLTIEITCPHNFSDEIKQKLMDAAEACPVLHSLHPEIEVGISYHWG